MKIFLSFVLCLSFAISAMAQHCPYDGGEMLVIELRDHNDKPIFGASPDLKLVERDNPNADACKYSPGLLELDMKMPIDAFIQKGYSTYTAAGFERQCPDCEFNRDGFYAAVIGQSERRCMIEEDMGKKPLRDRQYEVRYKLGTFEQAFKIDRQDFYSLCTSNGKWSRIKPVVLKLDKPKSILEN